MLKEIDKNIWVAEQPLKYFGLSVGTKMTVIRLKNSKLVVISPIQIDDRIITQLKEIGDVAYIIAPNVYHYLFVSDFKALYPLANLLAAPGLETKRPELPIAHTIREGENLFSGEIEYLLFDGFKSFAFDNTLMNEFVFFHPESSSLILTDTAFHFDDSFPLVTQLAFKTIGNYKKLSPSIIEKLATQEKEKVKQAVKKVLVWDFKRVIMAHGSIVENDAKPKFQEGYEWFLNTSL